MAGRFPYLEHQGIIAFSHRGGTSEWPENTLPAFQYSIDLGYRYLETDVHLSADGVLFAFHDDNLFRTTGVRANIGDLTAHEIERLLVKDRARIPRLAEIVTTWPQARLNLDPKSDAAVQPLSTFVARHKLLDRICIGSFHDRRVEFCRRELGPELCTSMGRLEVLLLLAVSRGLADPSRFKAACAQVPLNVKGVAQLDQRLVDAAHENNIDLHVWTVDEPQDMRHAVALGVDGIMTDRPQVLRSVLIECHQWEIQGVHL